LRVPAGGGATEKVSELIADAPKISADGRLAFCRVYDPQKKDLRPGIIATATGALVRYLDLPPGAVQRDASWINGDAEVLIVVSRDGIGNLWAVDVRTGALRPITRYDAEEIATVAVSHDRKRAAIVRGVPSSDLVLLQRTMETQ